MTHKQIMEACQALGMGVRQVPDTGRRSYRAKFELPGPEVYWSTSYEGGLLGLPRVTSSKRDVHARTGREIIYLVKTAIDDEDSVMAGPS